MSSLIQQARSVLLEPAGLNQQQLEKILDHLLGRKIDYADLYFQSVHEESWMIEDSIIKTGNFSIERGVGVRAISGEKQGFAYSDEIMLASLEQAASAARSIAKGAGQAQLLVSSRVQQDLALYTTLNPLSQFSDSQKIALLQQVDKIARAEDPRVKQVMASLNGSYEVVFIMTADGAVNADIRPLVRLSVQVIVEDKDRREMSHAGGGGRHDYQTFIDTNAIETHAKDAVRQAILNLDAVAAPAGTMPVVLGNGWPGVLLHEAIGHGLEGDFNRKGTSAFTGKMGQRIATPGCTVVDDGTLPGRRGSLNIDDEGCPTQCTVLIEDGILKGYMQDRLNANLMGMPQTGNGRRESYSHLPMPRMTNTYMLPGPYAPEEIIASVEKGLYAVNFGGGQVDITSGKFVFSANEAYLIEGGKITKPVKGATIIGNGPDVLTKVSMIGNDLALDSGVGTCGKDGQSVPVGVGQPTLKVDQLTVGGTAQ